MDGPWSVLLQRKRFKNDVVPGLRGSDFDKLVNDSVGLEQVGVGSLANLTFKSLPVHGSKVVHLFLLELCSQPALQAVKMNESDRPTALARNYARVFNSRFWAPAESAGAGVRQSCVQSHNGACFLKLLLIKFVRSLSHKLTSQILDSEFDSAKLDHVKLLDFVVLFML